MEELLSREWTGWAVLVFVVLQIIMLIREFGPKLLHGFIEMRKSAESKRLHEERAEKAQEIEMARQIYEDQKAKDDRMYNLMDRFSDRLSVFSEELTKFSITMQMIMTRLENIEKTQHDILRNQHDVDESLTMIEDRLPDPLTITTRRRRKTQEQKIHEQHNHEQETQE